MGSTDELFEELLGTDSGLGYEFDNADLPVDKVAAIPAGKLIAELHKIVAEVQGVLLKTPYENVRRPYIAVHKALNNKGEVPPRFRPTSTASKKWGSERSRAHNLISNDHQVLDLHWLSVEGGYDHLRDRNLPRRWQGLFRAGLDYEVAARFAGTAGSAANKAAILGLSYWSSWS